MNSSLDNPKTEFMTRRLIIARLAGWTMRMIASVLLIASAHVSSFANNPDKITLRLKNTEWSKVLLALEKASNYRFVYSNDIAPVNRKIDLVVRDAELSQIMEVILDNTGLSYRMMSQSLVVIYKTGTMDAEIRVTGRITDETGSPLPGASVRVKGTATGVSANANGEYAITAPDDATLVYSFVGYTEREIVIAGQTIINVTLSPSIAVQDQVVVIGYGTAAKRDLTGSIVKVSGREVADKPNTNPVASLQGKVAGVSIVNSGVPGQEPDIRIRGTISRYQTKPLYVVDGIFNDNINYINPADIESMEVLKDPSSLAIFGVRGANGVIIVTTKKGKSGQPTVSLSSTIGFKRIVDKPELTDAAGFKLLYDEQRANQGDVPYPDYGLFQGDSDWIELIQNENAMITSHSLSFANGTDRNKFYLGVGYILEEGLIKHEELHKVTVNISDELKVSNVFKFGFNVNGYRAWLPQVRSFSGALIATPIVEPFNTTYNVYNKLPELIGGPQIGNPLMGVEETKGTNLGREYRAVGSIFGEISFLRNLTLRANLLADLGFNNRRQYTPLINVYAAEIDEVTPQGGFTTTRVNQSDNTFSKFQQDYLLTFKKDWGDHGLNATAGFTTYYESFAQTSGSVSQYANRDPIPNDRRWWYLNVFPFGDPSTRVGNSDQWDRSTVSGLVRLLYNFRNKYLLNASFRRDGSSEISPDNRWDNFWAIGAAWELTDEDFMSSQQFFDYVKIKASIGKLGNQYNGVHYPYYPNYIPGQTAVFGSGGEDFILPAYVLAYRNDPNLRWEYVTSYEAGVEMNILQNRLRLEANYFHKLTNDLLTFVEAGSDAFYINAGEIENKGIEASASWSDDFDNGIKYTVSGNITTLNNKVKEVYTDGFTIIEGPSRTIAGYPIGHFFGYVHDGIYQSYNDKLSSPDASALGDYGPGDIKYRDLNNDGQIDVNDRTVIGNPTPDFIYGFSLGGSFKGLDLSLDFQGVYGNEVWRAWGNGNSFAQFNYRQARLNRWTGPGTSNWEPQVNDLRSINRENSTYMIEDGSYFRIRNLQIGYNFTGSWLSKAYLRSFRVFFNGQNLKTWKKNSGFTPEAGGSATSFGIDNGGYPLPAVFTFGINATF